VVEHSLGKGEVVGSIPTGSTIFYNKLRGILRGFGRRGRTVVAAEERSDLVFKTGRGEVRVALDHVRRTSRRRVAPDQQDR
jgi:hypothetical protein